MTYLKQAYHLMDSAEKRGDKTCRALFWDAIHYLDQAKTLRINNNQMPEAKNAHAKGIRIFKKAKKLYISAYL